MSTHSIQFSCDHTGVVGANKECDIFQRNDTFEVVVESAGSLKLYSNTTAHRFEKMFTIMVAVATTTRHTLLTRINTTLTLELTISPK